MFEEIQNMAQKRLEEKEQGIEHSEKIDVTKKTDIELQNEENNRKAVEQYEQ